MISRPSSGRTVAILRIRRVGNCAALSVILLHFTHGVCLTSAYEEIMS